MTASYDDLSGLHSFTNYSAMENERTIGDDFIDEANNTVPYTKQKRGYGEGDLRLGTSFSLDENIYSLAFIAQLNNWTIDKVTEKENSEPPSAIKIQQTPRGSL